MVGGEAAAPGSLRAGEHTFGRSTAEEVGVSRHILNGITSGRSKAPCQPKARAKRQSEQRRRVPSKRKRQTIRSPRSSEAAAPRTHRARRWAQCAISSAITTRHRLQRAASVEEKLYPPSSTRLQRVAARRHAPSSAAVARAKTRGERGFYFPLGLSGHRVMWPGRL